MLHPDVPDFAGGDRHLGLALYPLNVFDEAVDLLLAAEDRFVADHDAVDVAVAAGEVDDRAHLTLVAVLVLVDPGANRRLQTELASDRRHKLDTTRRRIGADRTGGGREDFKIGSDTRGARPIVAIGMAIALVGGIRNTSQLSGKAGGRYLMPRGGPKSHMYARHQRDDRSNDTHFRTSWG